MSKKSLEQELQIYNEILTVILKASQNHQYGNIQKTLNNYIIQTFDNFEIFKQTIYSRRKENFFSFFFGAGNKIFYDFESSNIKSFGTIVEKKINTIYFSINENSAINWSILKKEKESLLKKMEKKIT